MGPRNSRRKPFKSRDKTAGSLAARISLRLSTLHRAIRFSSIQYPPFAMHRQSVVRLACQYGGLPLVELPPPYLAPSLHFSLIRPPVQCSNFSSTAVAAGSGRDLSKSRGVSAIHRTGPKFPLGVSKYPLPKPATPSKPTRANPTPNHGLWDFFPNNKESLSTPEYDSSHGQLSHTFIAYIGCTLTIATFRSRMVHSRTP